MSKPMMALIAVGVAVLFVVGWIFFPSGNHGQSGPSDYDQKVQAQKDAAEVLSKKGGKVKEMNYAIGKASAVNLSGLTITDELMQGLKDLGNISEMDLSNSTVTDDDLGKMTKLNLMTFLTKLDLSNTAVTDAGLDKLENMVFLMQLNLTGSKCTKVGADRFKRNRETQKNIRTHNPTIKLN